ncbi:hypothetical protein MRX96_010674 [Rhipicephalus microplus]
MRLWIAWMHLHLKQQQQMQRLRDAAFPVSQSGSSQHTQPKEGSIVLRDSDNDDPQALYISSSDSDDEFVFHPD